MACSKRSCCMGKVFGFRKESANLLLQLVRGQMGPQNPQGLNANFLSYGREPWNPTPRQIEYVS